MNMEKDSVFARKLRAYRGKMTQAEIADILGISQNYYGQLERGLKLPSFEMIKQIISATGTDANYWFGIDSRQYTSSEKAFKQEDISTILSLLHNLSEGSNTVAKSWTEAINKNTTIAQLIVIIAQIRAYLSELDPAMLPESDRRTISDLLAACQRAMDSNEHPGPREGKNLKVIND